MAQKLYTNTRAKRMVINLGKQKNLTTPPSNPGPKCRGENYILNLWAKSRANNTGQEYRGKNILTKIYIYTLAKKIPKSWAKR
jgi:hypothetical protein